MFSTRTKRQCVHDLIWIHPSFYLRKTLYGSPLIPPIDKRNIKCDSKLKALFGHDQVNCFSMNKYLSGHLSKAEELV